jgi:NAD-dependent deacetylase
MYRNIVILTGAGISAESGIATFRDNNGLWGKYKVEEVATPNGYRLNPQLVHDFYNTRRRELADVQPNAAHFALAKLESAVDNCSVITQNVDDLHEKAGTVNLLHMHGELLKMRCESCSFTFRSRDDFSPSSMCSKCGTQGSLRPDIVWFEEMPKYLDVIESLLSSADLFISIGTSGAVYPAAGFIRMTPKGCRTVEFNLQRSLVSNHFQEQVLGLATETVPNFVQEIIDNES